MATRSDKFSSPRKTKKSLKENSSSDPDSAYSSDIVDASPPKSKRSNNHSPITPNSSPTKQLKNLQLSPKKLFALDHADHDPVAVEPTPFSAAKLALQNTTPNKIYERDTEIEELSKFLGKHLKTKKSGLKYVCGPPGTGKTITVLSVLRTFTSTYNFRQIYLNCTAAKTPNGIFSMLHAQLISKDSKAKMSYKTCVDELNKHFTNSTEYLVIVLDELDQLQTRKQDVLHKLFEWPLFIAHNILIIGISNVLDLPDRVLPKSVRPEMLCMDVMHFRPYTKEQIAKIITQRLNEASNATSLFATGAVDILSAKISAVSGDLRRALDIARRAIELVEQDMHHTLHEIDSNALHNEGDTKVTLKHVLNVVNSVFATNAMCDDQITDAFPVQQRIILAAIVLITSNTRVTGNEVTLGRLYDVYKRICAKRNIQHVGQGDIVNLCELIETRGIFQVVKGRKKADCVRMYKVVLLWDRERLSAAIQDKNLLSAILNDCELLK